MKRFIVPALGLLALAAAIPASAADLPRSMPYKAPVALAERGLDFADAALIFAGRHFTLRDDRHAYGETRFVTAGILRGRFVVLVWTPRAGGRRIISMRHGHDREKARFQIHLDRS